jgi:D-glycero-alpha-D-manno-heptose-7-phosphate kinase
MVIRATAPVRVGDIGGWTDTWYGQPGRVVHFAVAPGVEVTLERSGEPDPVTLVVDTYGERYGITPNQPRPARHPLLEAAFDLLPPDGPVTAKVSSSVPAGCGTGTSSAVAVALLGALAALRGEHPTPAEVAYLAFRLEVEVCGEEGGIQDQFGAAVGGISYLEISPFPTVALEALPFWDELVDRMTVVYLGRGHHSSSLHRQVIDNIKQGHTQPFDRMRQAAHQARAAVVEQDLVALGQAFVEANEGIIDLDPGLVGPDARAVIAAARAEAALGWKVNGSGGDGGSVTVLSASAPEAVALRRRVVALDPAYQVLPVKPVPHGLTVEVD